YGQRDPLVEYKKEAFDMFEDLMQDLQATFAERFLKVQVSAEPPRQPPRRMPPPPAAKASTTDAMFTGGGHHPADPPPAALETSLGRMASGAAGVPEVGRNDPCPCGSGKKYKKCHGAA
ncbi:MAG: SEC-C metal-binding domain-containing protein, partial [Gemmatimonadota bacterium]